MSVPPLRPNAFSVSICSVTVVSPFGSQPCLTPPERFPNTSTFSSMVSVTPYLAKAGLKPHMSPSRFWPCRSKPNGPGAVAAAGGVAASARNCGPASCGRARPRGSAPAEAGVCWDGAERDAAWPGLKGGIESA